MPARRQAGQHTCDKELSDRLLSKHTIHNKTDTRRDQKINCCPGSHDTASKFRGIVVPSHFRNNNVSIAAEVATDEPLMAEKPAIATIVAIPSPPGSLLNHLSKVSYNLVVIPELSAKPPMRTKSGIIVNG